MTYVAPNISYFINDHADFPENVKLELIYTQIAPKIINRILTWNEKRILFPNIQELKIFKF